VIERAAELLLAAPSERGEGCLPHEPAPVRLATIDGLDDLVGQRDGRSSHEHASTV
jgi:hypothetical protein